MTEKSFKFEIIKNLDKFDEISRTEGNSSVKSDMTSTTKKTFKALIQDNFDFYINSIKNVNFPYNICL